jgi:hypothetical protein
MDSLYCCGIKSCEKKKTATLKKMECCNIISCTECINKKNKKKSPTSLQCPSCGKENSNRTLDSIPNLNLFTCVYCKDRTPLSNLKVKTDHTGLVLRCSGAKCEKLNDAANFEEFFKSMKKEMETLSQQPITMTELNKKVNYSIDDFVEREFNKIKERVKKDLKEKVKKNQDYLELNELLTREESLDLLKKMSSHYSALCNNNTDAENLISATKFYVSNESRIKSLSNSLAPIDTLIKEKNIASFYPKFDPSELLTKFINLKLTTNDVELSEEHEELMKLITDENYLRAKLNELNIVRNIRKGTNFNLCNGGNNQATNDFFDLIKFNSVMPAQNPNLIDINSKDENNLLTHNYTDILMQCFGTDDSNVNVNSNNNNNNNNNSNNYEDLDNLENNDNENENEVDLKNLSSFVISKLSLNN